MQHAINLGEVIGLAHANQELDFHEFYLTVPTSNLKKTQGHDPRVL
jgi:hypothetical protein